MNTARTKGGLLGSLLVIILTFTTIPAFADVIVVDTLSDNPSNTTDCQLRDAIDTANNDSLGVDGCTGGSGKDTIVLPAGTIVLQPSEGPLFVESEIVLLGAGVGESVIDGADAVGLFVIAGSGDLYASDITFTNGFADPAVMFGGVGGAFRVGGSAIGFAAGGRLELVRTEVTSSSAGVSGGAISAQLGDVRVRDSFIANNSAPNGPGAGINADSSVVQIESSTFEGNIADTNGGAVNLTGTDPRLEVSRSTFFTNSTDTGNGGGISLQTGTATIRNSTLDRNVAFGDGGGLWVDPSAEATLNHVTLAVNAANDGGGVFLGSGARIDLIGNLFVDNLAVTSNLSCSIPAGGVTFDANNLLDDDTGCILAGTGNTILPGLVIGPLAFNGGPTQTRVPEPLAAGRTDCGRAQSNAGSLAVDQRGLLRPTQSAGLCTPGAVELDIVPILTATSPAGTNCPDAGTQLDVGTDVDGDGTLDAAEITSTSYICRSASASQPLVAVTNEPAGTNCTAGGIKIDVGLDTDGSGTLDPGEINTTSYVCNGEDAAQPLIDITPEPAGTNCTAGGQKVDVGVDTSGDGVLDPGEVNSTSYVCDGEDADQPLVSVSPEPAGANCTAGGQKIEVGTDDNFDGTLDPTEVDSTSYVCDGEDGDQPLVSVIPEPAGANCTFGGQKVDVGLDDNGDGTLDPGEVDTTSYVCDGEDGDQPLVDVSDEPAGGNCTFGGKKVDVGLDDNGDGVLDPNEIDSTSYVCDGQDGVDGQTPLVRVTDEPAGMNCDAGGEKVEIGFDADGNGTLDPGEVTETSFVCDGEDGASGSDALIVTSDLTVGDTECPAGGVRIDSGLDNGEGDDATADDGVLDDGEVDQTSFVCNTEDLDVDDDDDDGCGCSAASTPSHAAFPLLLFATGLLALRRRRRT